MIEKIKQLETLSRQLEPGAKERRALRNSVVDYSEQFLAELDSGKAYNAQGPEGDELYSFPFEEGPGSMSSAIEIIRAQLDSNGINPASGGHLGYIPGGGLFPSSLGDYLAAITNRYSGIFFANPGAVRMENLLLRWVADLLDYPPNFGGNLTSGGSIANLVGITTARDQRLIDSRDYHKAVFYLSQQTHHCVHKAIRIAGLADAKIRAVDLDDRHRMISSSLERMITEDRDSGLIPFMVVASAGTTDVGAVDPLQDIGVIANTHDLWYHIDAAYGGFFMLSQEFKPIFKGIELSDSVVLDPHKGLFLPYGTGLVLVKDLAKLRASYHYEASYLQDAQEDPEDISPADVSPELTKHFRGLRMWLPLKIFGLRPFRAALVEKILLCRYFYERLKDVPGFELGPYPELSVGYFRYLPQHQDANKFNQTLIQALHADGRVFLSSTRLNGNIYIRFAILSFRTHLDTVDRCLNMIFDNLLKLDPDFIPPFPGRK